MNTDWLKGGRSSTTEGKNESFLPPILITLFSISFVIVAFFYVRGWEEDKLHKNFRLSANTYQHLLEGRLRDIVIELNATRRFFQGSASIDRVEFSSFITEAINISDEIKVVIWVPKISNVTRQSLEAAEWLRGLNGSPIHVQDTSHRYTQVKPSPPRSTYYPVLYAEPMGNMEDTIGFDLASNPQVLERLEQARDDGVIVPITGVSLLPIMFGANDNAKSNIVLIQPVYRTTGVLETIKQRRDAHLGFLLLQFDIGLALESVVSNIEPQGINIFIVDVEADAGEEIVYYHASRVDKNTQMLTYPELLKTPDFIQKSSLNISRRQWKIMMVPSPKYFENNPQYQSWTTLVLGLLFSALLSYELFVYRRRTDVIQKLVKIRTQDLTDSETKQRAVIENIAEGIVTIDTKGIIESFNPAAEKMFGYKAEEALGNSVNFLLSEDDRSQHAAYIKNPNIHAPRIVNQSRELQAQHKGGHLFPIEITVSTMELHGEKKIIGIMHEITRRKNAEHKILESQKQALIANRAKSDLMANMSHELRTPLNAIIGFSSTIKEEILGPIGNDKYQEYLEDIHNSGQHLLELINDILDVSAIEAGALKLNEEYISPYTITEAMIRIVRPRAETGQVTVTSSIDPKLPQIYVDERRLKQVLLNLLSNAVKFTLQGGEVSVSARLNDGGSLSIFIRDSGIGMDAEEFDKALSKFGQVDSGLDRKHEGTGLGLPLTQGLIELHDGHFEIESEKGHGTQITVTLPKERVGQNA